MLFIYSKDTGFFTVNQRTKIRRILQVWKEVHRRS